MAPANTPGKKKRENNFFDVGVQGRKTGITLKDTGIRDEHGLEPLDGIFSSPEKSPAKASSSSRRGNATITTSTDMELESSGPDPAETLTARKLLRNSRTMLPPPLARSPIKTALGSSPRRQSSMGPVSLPRPSAITPNRAASHPVVARRLDFSVNEGISSVEPVSSSRSTRYGGGRGKRRDSGDIYDLPSSPVRGQRRVQNEIIEEEETLANGDMTALDNGDYDDSGVPAMDDSLHLVHHDDDNEESEVLPAKEPTPKPPAKRGRKRKSDAISDDKEVSTSKAPSSAAQTQRKVGRRPKTRESLASVPDTSAVHEELVEQPVIKRKGRPLKSKQPPPALLDVDATEESIVQPVVEDSSVMETIAKPPPKKRGPKPKGSKVEVHKDKPSTKDQEMPPPPSPKRAKKAAKPPAERDVNIRAPSRSRDTSVAASESGFKRPGSTISAWNYRGATPLEDPRGAYSTRSGRSVHKPLDFWVGEKLEYKHDGTKRQVVRADEIPEVKISRPRGRHASRRRDMSPIREEEEELEDWEKDSGIWTGMVKEWDDISAMATNQDVEEDIAFSALSLETREVDGANFRYGKVFGLPFFSVGMLDLPPGGFKRTKNCRKMHMAFFVATGKVNVDVGETNFTISKGGVWQVPRGNFYSIENQSQNPARIFFAQACEPVVEE